MAQASSPPEILGCNKFLIHVVDHYASSTVWDHTEDRGKVSAKLVNADLVKGHIISHRTAITSEKAKEMGTSSMYPGMGPAMADRLIEAIKDPKHWSRRM
jgi:hypothetical protein